MDSSSEKIGERIQTLLETFRRTSSDRADLSSAELLHLLQDRANRGNLSALHMQAAFQYRAPFHPPKSLVTFLEVIDKQSMQAPLADTLRNGKPQARYLAATCLADASHDTDPKVREAALRELPRHARREGLPIYLAAVADPDADVRWLAVHALKKYPDTQAIQPLIAALGDKNSLVRCSAARVLGKIADPSAVQPLETAAEDRDSFVRDAAKVALAHIETKSEN